MKLQTREEVEADIAHFQGMIQKHTNEAANATKTSALAEWARKKVSEPHFKPRYAFELGDITAAIELSGVDVRFMLGGQCVYSIPLRASGVGYYCKYGEHLAAIGYVEQAAQEGWLDRLFEITALRSEASRIGASAS